MTSVTTEFFALLDARAGVPADINPWELAEDFINGDRIFFDLVVVRPRRDPGQGPRDHCSASQVRSTLA